MRYGKKFVLTAVAALIVVGVAVAAVPVFKTVSPIKFDPMQTKLVQSDWIAGIGCPTNARQTLDGATLSSSYTDPACTTGDPADKDNKGLLLAKTGPTANVAAAFAQLKDVPSPTITEVGYDIRKPVGQIDPRGSHCGGGAPRFQFETTSGTVFGPGCNHVTSTVVGNGWIRLRWTVNFTDVTAVYIAFDEGQDTGPDEFGLAVLDNIDLNGKLVGRG